MGPGQEAVGQILTEEMKGCGHCVSPQCGRERARRGSEVLHCSRSVAGEKLLGREKPSTIGLPYHQFHSKKLEVK